ncbi:hypothetical protein L7F22_051802 [Adiantum nelumboides]|nr:hypothetical protein [Adiantum nelumboides]
MGTGGPTLALLERAGTAAALAHATALELLTARRRSEMVVATGGVAATTLAHAIEAGLLHVPQPWPLPHPPQRPLLAFASSSRAGPWWPLALCGCLWAAFLCLADFIGRF